jgi:hypothetical protein
MMGAMQIRRAFLSLFGLFQINRDPLKLQSRPDHQFVRTAPAGYALVVPTLKTNEKARKRKIKIQKANIVAFLHTRGLPLPGMLAR